MQFKVRATEYTEAGALTNIYYDYAFGMLDAAKAQYDQMNREYYKDSEGKSTGIKKYKMSFWVATYKQIENVDDLFELFQDA